MSYLAFSLLQQVRFFFPKSLFVMLNKPLTEATDNWLHLTTTTDQVRVYEKATPPINLNDSSFDLYASSYVLNSTSCSDLTRLCSLDNEQTGIAEPEFTYLLLNTGITDQTANFTNLDFATLDAKADKASASLDMVVHTNDSIKPAHSFLFWSGAVDEYETEDLSIENYGLDYVAQTKSVSTTCSFITSSCDIVNATSSQGPLLYDCYDTFIGDLSRAPPGGIEQVVGWDTGFYDSFDGAPQKTSTKTQSNPFKFFVAAEVQSSLTSVNDTQAYFSNQTNNITQNHDLFYAGSGRIVFMLNCTSGVYDVNYTLTNGNITDFNATLSDSATTAIIRAPFERGFGTYNLVQRAFSAIIDPDTFLDTMALAVSQVTIAGAFGAFTYGPNIAQRFRYNRTVTQISKPALIYFIVICVLYATLGLGLMIAAFALRAKQRVREKQASLLPDPERSRIRRLDIRDEEVNKKRRGRISGILDALTS